MSFFMPKLGEPMWAVLKNGHIVTTTVGDEASAWFLARSWAAGNADRTTNKVAAARGYKVIRVVIQPVDG